MLANSRRLNMMGDEPIWSNCREVSRGESENEREETNQFQLILVGLAGESEQLRIMIKPHGRSRSRQVLNRLPRFSFGTL